jgi:hypothetical protein
MYRHFSKFWEFTVRSDTDRPCMLVIMGTLEDGSKELVAAWVLGQPMTVFFTRSMEGTVYRKTHSRKARVGG